MFILAFEVLLVHTIFIELFFHLYPTVEGLFHSHSLPSTVWRLHLHFTYICIMYLYYNYIHKLRNMVMTFCKLLIENIKEQTSLKKSCHASNNIAVE